MKTGLKKPTPRAPVLRGKQSASLRCPKCGSQMVDGTCTKCKYSRKTAYRSRREAKEYTFAGD